MECLFPLPPCRSVSGVMTRRDELPRYSYPYSTCADMMRIMVVFSRPRVMSSSQYVRSCACLSVGAQDGIESHLGKRFLTS